MISKILGSIIFICCIFALSLSFFGVEHVEMAPSFIAFLKSTSIELENYKIAIPSIPQIPAMSQVGGFAVVLNVLITFVNGLSSLLNFVITIFNVIIQLLQFIFLLLRNLITMRDSILEGVNNNSSTAITAI